MRFRQVAELEDRDNDAYIMDVVAGRVLINKNYNAIEQLSLGLQHLVTTNLPDQFSIYSSYGNPDSGVVLYYCPDNHSAVRVTKDCTNCQVLPYPDNEMILSPVHFWDGDRLIVSTFSGDFLAFSERRAEVVPSVSIMDRYPNFHSFWSDARRMKVWSSSSDYGVVQDEDHTVLYYNHNSGIARRFVKPAQRFHEVVSNGVYALFVGETEVHLVSHKGNVGRLPCDPSRDYQRGRFSDLEEAGTLFLLSSSKNNHRIGYVEKFQVLRDH